MKIRDVVANPLRNTGQEKEGKVDAARSSFQEQITRAQGRMAEERLNRLLGDIDRQGEILAERLTFNELVKYKKLIRAFLDEAVKNSFRNEESRSWNRGGRPKVYLLVNRIDERLSQLTEEILSREKDALNILKIVGEIKGLLIDLYT